MPRTNSAATASPRESVSAQSASAQLSQSLSISNQEEMTDLASQSASVTASNENMSVDSDENRLVIDESVDIVSDSAPPASDVLVEVSV